MQLLNVLNGGLLVQDVDNHAIYGTHPISNGEITLEITSLHHQMVYPFTIDKKYYDILFWSSARGSHYDGDQVSYKPYMDIGDPEVVLYHSPDNPVCLGIQGHPEMMNLESETVKYLNNLLDNYAKS